MNYILKGTDLFVKVVFYLMLVLIASTILLYFVSGTLTSKDERDLVQMVILSVGLYAVMNGKETPVLNRMFIKFKKLISKKI